VFYPWLFLPLFEFLEALLVLHGTSCFGAFSVLPFLNSSCNIPPMNWPQVSVHDYFQGLSFPSLDFSLCYCVLAPPLSPGISFFTRPRPRVIAGTQGVKGRFPLRQHRRRVFLSLPYLPVAVHFARLFPFSPVRSQFGFRIVSFLRRVRRAGQVGAGVNRTTPCKSPDFATYIKTRAYLYSVGRTLPLHDPFESPPRPKRISRWWPGACLSPSLHWGRLLCHFIHATRDVHSRDHSTFSPLQNLLTESRFGVRTSFSFFSRYPELPTHSSPYLICSFFLLFS